MPHNLYLHSAVCKNRRLLIVDAEDVDVSTNNNNNNNNNNTDQADCQEDVPFSDEGTVDDDEKTSIGNDETNHRSFDESADSEELLPDSDETRLSDSVWMTIKFSIFDTLIALTFAFIINSTILIVGASAFNSPDGSKDAEGLEEAYAILKQYVGPVAATCFAIALLMSGQSSSITGTLAGEIVMSGFLDLRIRPAIRRVVTRLCAIIPAVISILAFGGNGEKLIVYSQVILSAQLPFAIFPLIYFTGTPKLMKISRNTDFSNGIILTLFSYFCGVIITGLNMYLSLAQIASG
jgi:NRAMP (natural resistance-associated macrophage protein)-like metal ion transporter